jgi:ankyrin repeat protein
MTHPHEAKFIHRFVPNNTPLHCLLRAPDLRSAEYKRFVETTHLDIRQEIANMRLQAVRALVEANPSIVSTPDCIGQTPLHLACVHVECCKGAAEILLNACPTAACIQDSSGKTPLHYLLLSVDQDVPICLIGKLISVAPDALHVRDKRGRTPLEIVQLNRGQSEDIVAKLLATEVPNESDNIHDPVYVDIAL